MEIGRSYRGTIALLSTRPTDRATTVISALGACIGFIGLGRHFLRSFALVTCQARVKHLTGLVKEDQIDESHRDSLSSWPFRLLDTYQDQAMN